MAKNIFFGKSGIFKNSELRWRDPRGGVDPKCAFLAVSRDLLIYILILCAPSTKHPISLIWTTSDICRSATLIELRLSGDFRAYSRANIISIGTMLFTDRDTYNSLGFESQPFLILHACYLIVCDIIYVYSIRVASKPNEL